MMAPTHIIIGLLTIYPLIHSNPELIVPLTISSIIGSVLPDLDILVQHRKTLHFPILSLPFVTISMLLILINPITIYLLLTSFIISFAIHPWVDIISSGLEKRPWEENSTRAAYNHQKQEWIKPKNLFYDGSITDFSIFTFGIGILFILDYESVIQYKILIFSLFCISFIYTISRKHLPILENYLDENIPQLGWILNKLH